MPLGGNDIVKVTGPDRGCRHPFIRVDLGSGGDHLSVPRRTKVDGWAGDDRLDVTALTPAGAQHEGAQTLWGGCDDDELFGGVDVAIVDPNDALEPHLFGQFETFSVGWA
ncbi:MAG TPA: hypothetical protein VF228_20175 [Iamia sp.]